MDKKVRESIKQEQEKVSILNAIIEVIASKDNIIDIFKEIKDYLYSIIPCDFITVLFNNERARYFYVAPALNISKYAIDSEVTIPYHETSITEILRSKSTIRRDDLDERGNMTPGDLKFLAPGIRSDISIPIITNNHVRAVLNFSSYKSNRFTSVHESILEEVGLILSISLYRIDLAEEVRSLKLNANQWRNKYKTLLENSKQPIIVINSDLASIYETNSAFELLTGYRSQQLNGMRFTALHPKIQAHILTKAVQDAAHGKTAELKHIELLKNNGEHKPVNVQFFTSPENEEPKLFVVYEDAAEKTIRVRDQETQIRSFIHVGNELLATTNLELISISLLDELGLCQNARYVTLHLYDDSQKKLNLYCARKYPFDNGMSIVHPWLIGLKQGPYSEVLEKDRFIKCNNIYTDNQFYKWLPIAQKLGYNALISMPLNIGNQKIGVVTLFYEHEQNFSNQTVSTLKNISNYLALLINNHKLHRQLKKSQQQLSVIQDILHSINSRLDLKEIIQTTAIQIKRMVEFDHFFITLFDSNTENYQIYAIVSETYHKLFSPKTYAPIEKTNLGWLYVPQEDRQQNGKITPFTDWFNKLKSKIDTLLLVKDKYLGAITIGCLEPNKYTKEHEDFLTDISSHISFAIENFQLYTITQQKQNDFTVLAELSDDLQHISDRGELISTVLQFVCKSLKSQMCTFRFVEKDNVRPLVYPTLPDAEQQDLLQKENHEFAPHIISTNKILSIENMETYSGEKFTNLNFPKGFRSYLGVPINYRNTIFGVLSVYWRHEQKIEGSLLNLVSTISLLTSTKIENIRLLNATSQNTDNLKSTNEELENFVYTVSHDLKSPIVSIQGFASILLNDFHSQLDEDSQHYLKRIQANANQMETLVTDLLELSRIGRVVSPFEEVAIREIITQVLGELVYQIERRGIKTNLPDKMAVVFCDKKRISQVFSNLIENAIKYIGKENPCPTIEIGWKDENDDYLFYIKDNGIGIPKEYHHQIFGLFRQVNQEELDEISSGVGLAIVKRIIDNHGGKIWFDSEPRKGSTFYFTIPKKNEN